MKTVSCKLWKESAYAEVVQLRRNQFLVPSGAVGKDFVDELSKLFLAYAQRSAWDKFALKGATILPHLLLQRPHGASKAKDHVSFLARRLAAWKESNINGLVCEGHALQAALQNGRKRQEGKEDKPVATFSHG